MFDSQRRTTDARRDQVAPQLDAEREPRARVIREEKEGMFSEAWFWLAGLLMIVGAFTRETGFMALAACLVTVIVVSWLWNRYSLHRLSYRRHFDRQRVFPGETIQMTIEVTNHKFVPLSWVRFRDEFPLVISPEGVTLSPAPSSESTGYLLSAFGLRWYERTRRQFRLQCQQRGHYFLGPVVAESGDVFTLFTSKEERLVRDPIIVYPQVYPLDELGFPSRAPFGEGKARQSLIEDPTRTRGIRDYRPEDGFRHVHWKASARRSELQTRVYEPTSDMNLMVVLDVATMPKIWQGIRPDLLERAISVAASVANYAAERRWTLGLLSNGVPRSDQPIKVLPGRSPDQLARVLEALAAVTSFAAGSIETILQVESPRIPLGATLVVVSAVENEELLATLIHLREAGRRVVLVSLADQEPPDDLPFQVYHLPAQVPAVWHRSSKDELNGTLAGIPVPQPVTTVPSS
jgi:uncharacterized protein (DUF58 family)